MRVESREATADDSMDVRRVLDAAMLEVREDLPERIEAGDVLVAEEAGGREAILGALVLVPREGGVHSQTCGAHVDAVAVRRARRGRGIGSALVRAAAERRSRLTAAFDPGVRPFYESLGFEIAPTEGGDDDRLRGVFEAED